MPGKKRILVNMAVQGNQTSLPEILDHMISKVCEKAKVGKKFK